MASRREERGRRGEERSGLSNLNLDVVDTSSITSDEGNNRFNKRWLIFFVRVFLLIFKFLMLNKDSHMFHLSLV